MVEKFGKKVRKLMVEEMSSTFTDCNGFVFSSIDEIKASEIDVLRKQMRQSGSKYMVIKNRLADIALKEAGIDGFSDVLESQKIIGVGVLKEDPVQTIKLLTEFAKKKKGFEVSKGYLEGKVLTSEKVEELSLLPAREQLIAMVVGTMQAPISGFVRVLAVLLKNILYAINAIKEKKEKENS